MRINNASLRRMLLCSTVAAAAFSHNAAFAQNTEEAEQDGNSDVIVVTGSILSAQQASIATKREAPNLIDVASADAVGRFPDENTAAALARLPGVAVQRDQGQARYIQVRGAPNRWTSVSINGIPQTGVDEGGEGRAYRFDAVPAVLLSELRVNKSLTPDITAEAITANIDLRTFSALSRPGVSVSGDVGYGWMDLGGGEQRQGSLRFGYSEGNWGVVLGGSHYKRAQVTDNREADYDTDANGNPVAPTDIDVRSYLLDRETNGLFGAFEFEPEMGQLFYVRGIYTEFKDDEQRNAYQFELDEAESGTRGLLAGDLVGVPVDGAFNDAQYRNMNYIFSAGADLNFDDWGMNIAAGYTKTENSTDLPLTLSGATGENSVSLTYDRTDDARFPIITGLFETDFDAITGAASRGAPLSTFDQTSLNGFTFVLPIVTDLVSDAYTGKVDVWKNMGDVTLKAGLLYQMRDITGNVADADIVIIPGFDVNSYVTSNPWDTNFPLGVNFNYYDNAQLDADQRAYYAANGINLIDQNSPQSFFEQEETIWAGYMMGEYETGDLLIIAGARAEYYEIGNSGSADVDGVITPLSTTKDYFDIFPSVNLRYNVTDDLVFRVAGQRGVSRPAYASIRISSSIDDANEVISGGNPTLDPEYTWGLDASLEYYLPGNGIISVAAFHRSVEDVLYSSTQIVGDASFDSNGIDRSGYRLSADFNGLDGTVNGIEFNAEHQLTFLPGPLAGLGVQGNLTFLDGDFDAVDAAGNVFTSGFPGLSDTIVNASVFYEMYGVSARVSYQWRSDYMDSIGGLGIGAGAFRGAYENLDVTVRYKVNDNFTVYADLANLTDETYTAYLGSAATPTEVEQIGSRYMFGLRFDF